LARGATEKQRAELILTFQAVIGNSAAWDAPSERW
jgi:hypothetical protein